MPNNEEQPVAEKPKKEVIIEEKPNPEDTTEEKTEEVETTVDESESKEDEVEEKSDETEVKSEETQVEESIDEDESSEEDKKTESDDVAPENLSKDIKSTKEEIALLNDVRDELVTLYAEKRDLNISMERFSAELQDKINKVDELENTNNSLTEQLSVYKKADEEKKASEKLSRLSALSEKFKLLGQEKSVEKLASKDDETIKEFENIVDAAIARSGETTAMPTVTKNSQTVEVFNKSEEETPSKEIKKDNTVSPSKEQFYKKICSALTNEQVGNYKERRTITL